MSKLRKSYRLEKAADDEIKRVAELSPTGLSEAEVIEMWAAQSARRAGVGGETVTEKKSGGAAEVLQDDIPDEIVAKGLRAKVRAPLPKVVKGSELPEPKKKLFAGPVLDIQNGRIANQATNLAAARAGRAPLKRPGEK